jgi:anti-sigma factor RsiW
MTDCNLIREELVAYLDGELDDACTREVAAHVAACEACERERQALATAWQHLELLPGLEPRAGWLAEVEGRILRDAAPPLQVLSGGRSSSGGRAVRRWIAAAAAVLMAAGASLIVVTWPPSSGTHDVALRPDGPAPVPPKPTPVVVPTTEPRVVEPVDVPVVVTPGVDPLAALPAEERELVENLELLRDLEELEALGLLDAAEMFDDLDLEEFDEG